MKTADLTFTAECAPLLEPLLTLSGTRLLGTEIYTYCRLAADNLYGQLWAGVDGQNRLLAALLDNGHYRTLLTPDTAAVGKTAFETADFFRMIPKSGRFRVMLNETPAREADKAAARLEGGALLEAASALHGRPLKPEEEERGVYYARAVNAGLSDFLVLYDENARPCACAQIVAKNRRCALIGNVYTAPAYRGQGLAGKLLAACEARAAGEGLLPVLYCNKNMTRFYRARGYRIVRSHEL